MNDTQHAVSEKVPFDAIYVLTSLATKDRIQSVTSQLNDSGLADTVPVHTVFAPNSRLISHIISVLPTVEYIRKNNWAFQCTIGHYLILHDAVAREYERILVLEDDIRLINDRREFYRLLNRVPDDYDIAMLDWWPYYGSRGWTSGRFADYMNSHKNEVWVRWADFFVLRSSGAYMLSSKGMKTLIEIQDSCLPGSKKIFWGNILHACDELFDNAFQNQFGLNCYVSNPIIARQPGGGHSGGGNDYLYDIQKVSGRFDKENYGHIENVKTVT